MNETEERVARAMSSVSSYDWREFIDNGMAKAVVDALPQGEPVAWVLQGDDTARSDGFIDARIDREGEFTKPLYAAPAHPMAEAGVREAVAWRWASIFNPNDWTLSATQPEPHEQYITQALGVIIAGDKNQRDAIAAIIEPEAMAEYEAEFAKKPGGPTYTMMANYPQVKSARDKAEAILAFLSTSPSNGEGWRPIETAPNHLNEILGYQETAGDHKGRMAVCWQAGVRPSLWVGGNGLMPTHWRPLPAPPEDKP